jgi:hypothetical protein
MRTTIFYSREAAADFVKIVRERYIAIDVKCFLDNLESRIVYQVICR